MWDPDATSSPPLLSMNNYRDPIEFEVSNRNPMSGHYHLRRIPPKMAYANMPIIKVYRKHQTITNGPWDRSFRLMKGNDVFMPLAEAKSRKTDFVYQNGRPVRPSTIYLVSFRNGTDRVGVIHPGLKKVYSNAKITTILLKHFPVMENHTSDLQHRVRGNTSTSKKELYLKKGTPPYLFNVMKNGKFGGKEIVVRPENRINNSGRNNN